MLNFLKRFKVSKVVPITIDVDKKTSAWLQSEAKRREISTETLIEWIIIWSIIENY